MIAAHINQPPKEADLSSVGNLFGSGNSGRVSSELKKRARRPFTHRLYKEAEDSQEYLRLCQRLEYPLVYEGVSVADRISGYTYTGLSQFSWVFKFAESRAQWFKEILRSGKNIQ